MLEVQKGCFAYPKSQEILSDITFSLGEGKIMTVLGQNGIGKTTLLKCITGILKWTSGAAFLNGNEIKETKDFKGLGYVPQAHPMSFSYSVRQIVTMGRSRSIHLLSVPSAMDKEMVEQAMEEVGIADLADRSCNALSGGQLQLAFIARALVSEPKIMILDEPESHLDFKNQFMILRLIERLSKEKNISCIINTHFPEHAMMISDQTLMLGKGKYLFGKASDVIRESIIEEFFQIKASIIEVPGASDGRKAFVVMDTI
jgi:iron complex transport system ATP-binding protein